MTFLEQQHEFFLENMHAAMVERIKSTMGSLKNNCTPEYITVPASNVTEKMWNKKTVTE